MRIANDYDQYSIDSIVITIYEYPNVQTNPLQELRANLESVGDRAGAWRALILEYSEDSHMAQRSKVTVKR